MARSPQLEALRAQVLARHEAATKKVSRLRRVSGIEVGGTKFDPRVEPAEIRRMNTRQAVRHLARLESFMSRGTRFVAGAERRPIPREKWRQYRKAEAVNRAAGEKHFERVRNVRLPNGQTIGEYQDQMSPKGFRRMGFTRGNPAYLSGERSSRGVRGVNGIDKLIADMNRKNRSSHGAKMVREARRNMVGALEGGGVSGDVVARAKRLTDYQVDVLWHYTSFSRDAGEKYFFNANDAEGGSIRPTTSHADMEAALNAQIEWASTLQPEGAEPQRPHRRRR